MTSTSQTFTKSYTRPTNNISTTSYERTKTALQQEGEYLRNAHTQLRKEQYVWNTTNAVNNYEAGNTRRYHATLSDKTTEHPLNDLFGDHQAALPGKAEEATDLTRPKSSGQSSERPEASIYLANQAISGASKVANIATTPARENSSGRPSESTINDIPAPEALPNAKSESEKQSGEIIGGLETVASIAGTVVGALL